MDLTLDNSNSLYQIRSYAPGQLVINQLTLMQSVIVTPEQLIHPWTPQSYAELTTEQITALAEFKPTIVLLGTGEKSALPNPALLTGLYQHRIGVEVMNTAAACRTFNVLAAEGRNVAAALIIR